MTFIQIRAKSSASSAYPSSIELSLLPPQKTFYLPSAWLKHSFSFGNAADLAGCAQVCKYWNSCAEPLLARLYRDVFFPSILLGTDLLKLRGYCETRKELILENVEQNRYVGSVREMFKGLGDERLHHGISRYSSQYGSLFFKQTREAADVSQAYVLRVNMHTGAVLDCFPMKPNTFLQHRPHQTLDAEVYVSPKDEAEALSLVRWRIPKDEEISPSEVELNIKNSLSQSFSGDCVAHQMGKKTILFNSRTGKHTGEIEISFAAIKETQPFPQVCVSAICQQKLCVVVAKEHAYKMNERNDSLLIFDLKTGQYEDVYISSVVSSLHMPKLYVTAQYVIIYYPKNPDLTVIDLKERTIFRMTPDILVNAYPLRIQRREAARTSNCPEGTSAVDFVKVVHFFNLVALTVFGRTRIYDLATRTHLATLIHAFDEFYHAAWHDGIFMIAGNRSRRTIQEIEVFDFGSQGPYQANPRPSLIAACLKPFIDCCCYVPP